MVFIDKLYTDENITDVNIVLSKLKKHEFVMDVYCICIDKSTESIMEIIHSYELFKKVYENKNYIVVGIAKGKKSALKIVCDIINEVFEKENIMENTKEVFLKTLVSGGEHI